MQFIGGSSIKFDLDSRPKIPSHLLEKIDFIGPYLETGVWSQTLRLNKTYSSKKNDSRPFMGLGSPSSQKKGYNIPDGTIGGKAKGNSQMVWGPGSFGVSMDDLETFYEYYCESCDTKDVTYDTENHGKSGGDNFMEGSLDTQLISSMGEHVPTIVSNTNTSMETEEGQGFGWALLNFLIDMNNRDSVPTVLSMSLGSLSYHSCDAMCQYVYSQGGSYEMCGAYLQKQRQVCMFPSADVENRINIEFAKLGLRGVTLLAASGDGGSHFSFQKYEGYGEIVRLLNEAACRFNWPTYPSSSNYVLSVGGTSWDPDDDASRDNPVGWHRSGCGFSWVYPVLSFQTDAQKAYLDSTKDLPKADAYNASGRGYPDISALAVDIPLCTYGGCSDSGGTSASAPEIAGVMSLINEQRLQNGLSPLGFVNPRLYQFAASHKDEMFRDITSGKSNFQCDEGFSAQKGWDSFTGFGEPNFAGLIKYLGSDGISL